MRNVKLKPGNCEIIQLNKKIFEEKTNFASPYYPAERTVYPFAVCPQCDNPVKIIGFYKDIKKNPYAEHHDENVDDLAKFIEENKRFCPYYDKRRSILKTERRIVNPLFLNGILPLLKNQFDRIIFILEKTLGFYISDDLAREMLSSFVASKAWEYSWTTKNNLPWVFGYLQNSKTLMGRLIDPKSPLYSAIYNKCDYTCFLETKHKGSFKQLISKNENVFLSINFCIMHHERKNENGMLYETMRYLVTQKINYEENSVIYDEIFNIDEKYFLNLINKKENENKRFRKYSLQAIANEYL